VDTSFFYWKIGVHSGRTQKGTAENVETSKTLIDLTIQEHFGCFYSCLTEDRVTPLSTHKPSSSRVNIMEVVLMKIITIANCEWPFQYKKQTQNAPRMMIPVFLEKYEMLIEQIFKKSTPRKESLINQLDAIVISEDTFMTHIHSPPASSEQQLTKYTGLAHKCLPTA